MSLYWDFTECCIFRFFSHSVLYFPNATAGRPQDNTAAGGLDGELLELAPPVRNARIAFHEQGAQAPEALLATVNSAQHSLDASSSSATTRWAGSGPRRCTGRGPLDLRRPGVKSAGRGPSC